MVHALFCSGQTKQFFSDHSYYKHSERKDYESAKGKGMQRNTIPERILIHLRMYWSGWARGEGLSGDGNDQGEGRSAGGGRMDGLVGLPICIHCACMFSI